MTIHYVFRNGKWVERGGPEDTGYEGPKARGYVIPDSMDAAWCPLDGKMHDSKSRVRKMARSLGFEERGNEWTHEKPDKPDPQIKEFLREQLNR